MAERATTGRPRAVRSAAAAGPTASSLTGSSRTGWSQAALVALLASTLVLAPGGLFRFALPKLALVALGVLAAALAPARGRLHRSVVWLVGAGGAVLVVAALTGGAPLAQLIGRWPRYEGLVALPLYVGALWAGARLLGPQVTSDSVRRLWRCAAVASTVLGAASAAEAAGLRPLGGDVARPGALLGNASDQGLVGVLLLALLCSPAVRTRDPLLRVGLGGAAVTVVTSASRGALLGALVALAVCLAGHLWVTRTSSAWWRRRDVLGIAVTGLVLTVGTLAVPLSRARALGTSDLAAQTVTGRVDLWRSALDVVAAAPLLGAGPSGLVDALPAHRTSAWAASTDPLSVVDSSHSWPVQALVAGGVPLLLLALALAAVVLLQGFRRLRSSAQPDLAVGALAAVLGYGVGLGTHFTTAGTTVLAAVLAGALVAVPDDGRRWAARVVTPLAGVLAATLMLGTAAEYPLAAAVRHASVGEVAAADHDLLLAQRLRPWDRDVPLVAAGTFFAGTQAGDVPSAQAAARWAARSLEATGSLEAQRILGAAQVVAGDPAAAVGTLDAALRRSPHDASVQVWRGLALVRVGQEDAAEQAWVAATGNAPTSPTAWRLLAELYESQGRAAEHARALAMVDSASG